MCTLIALWRCHPSAPLIMALNRDEFLDRPTAPMGLWPSENPAERIIAGRDLKSGGTWFGVGAGVTAGLTNHRAGVRSMAGTRSRGELVAGVLRQPDMNAAERFIKALDPKKYGPFHLVAADPESMIWITNASGEMAILEVEPGLHVLGNYGLDNESDPVVAGLKSELSGAAEWGEADLRRRLAETLARHGEGWPCVHRGPYGTRSSAILWRGGANEYLGATDGPPCRAEWKDETPLLKALAATS